MGTLNFQSRNNLKLLECFRFLGDLHSFKLEFQFVKCSSNFKLLRVIASGFWYRASHQRTCYTLKILQLILRGHGQIIIFFFFHILILNINSYLYVLIPLRYRSLYYASETLHTSKNINEN